MHGKRLIPTFDVRFFHEIDSEEKAYWFGFVMADGCVNITRSPSLQFCIHPKDATHLQRFHDALKSSNKIHTFATGYVGSSHYSCEIVEDLTRLGCTPRKSKTKQFPALPDPVLRDFVRGYLDGNGCFSTSWNMGGWQTSMQITSGSLDFITELRRRLTIKAKVYGVQGWGKAFVLKAGGNRQVRRLADWLYDGATVYLPRKREAAYAHFI